MKVFFSRKSVIIMLAALAVAAVAIVSLNTSGDSGVITRTANSVAKPLKMVASSIAGTFESIYGNIYRYDKIVDENEELKKQLAELRREYREYIEISEENARLRELHGFAQRHTDHDYEPAVVIQPGAANWSSTFTISKGSSNSKIAVGNSVITESGALVGRVTGVDSTTSTVVSVIDTTFSANVLVVESGAAATAKGDFALMRQGLMKLTYISGDTAVLPGDAIITSGKGGVYPNGLTIGEVIEVLDYNAGVDRYAVVRPTAEIDSVSHVFVITGFDIMD